MSEEKQSFLKKNMSDKKSRLMIFFLGTAAVVLGGYFAFAGGGAEEALPSTLRNAPNRADTKLVDELNPAYKQELEEADRQRIEQARKTGQSAFPTIIGTKTEEQNTLEIKVDPPKPEIVRPKVKEVKPVKPVVIPEPKPEPIKIVRPAIEAPKPVERGPVNLPMTPVTTAQQQPEVRLVERPAPQTNQELLAAYQRQMAEIQAFANQGHGDPATSYFYQPPSSYDTEVATDDVLIPGNVVGQDVVQDEGSLTLVGESQSAATAYLGGASEEIPVDLPLPGKILYAQMVTTADSDAPGPVVAEILQGDLAGSRVIGSFSVANEKLVLEFNSITIDETLSGQKVGNTYPISAVAVDTKHVGTAVASDVNRRMFQRIAVTFATSFVEGMGKAIAESGTSSETDTNGSTTTSTPVYSTDDQMKIAAGAAAGEVGSIVKDYYGSRGVTVKMEAGVPMGILFLN